MKIDDSRHKGIQKRVKLKTVNTQKHSRLGSVKNELNNLTKTVEAALNEVGDIMISQSNPRQAHPRSRANIAGFTYFKGSNN